METEAYEPGDPASHGFRRHDRPQRHDVRPARAPLRVLHLRQPLDDERRDAGPGEGSAVLLRALEPLEGLEAMARPGDAIARRTCARVRGSSRRRLAVDRSLDGADLVRGREVWIEAGSPVDPSAVTTSGGSASASALERPWRFFVRGDPFVSRGRPGPAAPRRRLDTVIVDGARLGGLRCRPRGPGRSRCPAGWVDGSTRTST